MFGSFPIWGVAGMVHDNTFETSIVSLDSPPVHVSLFIVTRRDIIFNIAAVAAFTRMAGEQGLFVRLDTGSCPQLQFVSMKL